MKRQDILKQKAVLASGEEKSLSELFVPGDFQDIDGNDFITFKALLRAAKKTYGIRGYACNIVQTPESSNGWCATVVARYEFGGAKGFEEMQLIFDGAADCREGSTSPGFDKYMIALAETRAKARSLRDALGVEICSSDEIARPSKGERSFTNADGKEKIEATQAVVIRTKFMKELGKTLEDVEAVIGRKVENIEECTKEEAGNILAAFNKHTRKK